MIKRYKVSGFVTGSVSLLVGRLQAVSVDMQTAVVCIAVGVVLGIPLIALSQDLPQPTNSEHPRSRGIIFLPERATGITPEFPDHLGVLEQPTGPPGCRLGAGLGLSRSIPVRSKRLELGFPGRGATLVLGKLGGGAGQRPNEKCRLRWDYEHRYMSTTRFV